ncbi:MAG: 2-hydroxychromene-2-carboxylate isomerase [Pseudomonadota bacterium]
MSSKILHFHFDYISPFAYFASLKLPALCEKYSVELVYCPTVFAGLLNHWGQLGPAEIPGKAQHTFKQCMRYAILNDIPYRGPKHHPFNPLTSLRVSMLDVANENQALVIKTIYELGWAQGGDLGSDEAIISALNLAGLDGEGLVVKTKDQKAKDALHAMTDSAINKGVFGVPTMLIDDELFWGIDQLANLDLYLQGKDPLAGLALEELSSQGPSAWRPNIEKRTLT